MSFGHNRRATPRSLYQLQARWDDDCARARIHELRDQMPIAADTRLMPLALLLAAVLITLLAAVAP